MTQAIALAKISRPRLSHMVSRERLFGLLDQASSRPVIWITGPGGAGKTSLAASWLDARNKSHLWYQVDAGDGDLASFFYYLSLAAQKIPSRSEAPQPVFTPEFMQGVAVFTRRYFESLFCRLPPAATLLFDNFQDAPEDSGWHEMMAHALETIPEGSNVIVLSREPPPAAFVRLQANNLISVLGWEDIRFSREESRELLFSLGAQQESLRLLDDLYYKTEGWAAGLVLLTSQMRAGALSHLDERSSQYEIFNYFANEIFARTEADVQDVLLKTAFLSRVEPEMAVSLSGVAHAAEILERLNLMHYFTQRYGAAFQYHPLFKAFLQVRAAATFPPSEVLRIKQHSAGLLAEAGQIEEAVRLYIGATDWNGALSLMLEQAAALLAQGRCSTLENWLQALPPPQLGASAWGLYWLGVCRLPFDPVESRDLFERAFELFQADSDISGVFLSWASIVDTFLYQWSDFSPLDRWITVIEQKLAKHPEFPSPEIEARVAAGMLNALAWRQPHRADLPVWAERVRQIVHHHPSVQLRVMLGSYLMIYYLWMGDFAKSGLLIDELRPVLDGKERDPLTQQNWHVMEAMHAWFTADEKACMAAVEKGLRNADESGVHLLDMYLLGQGVYAGLSLGDPEAAIACLKKMVQIDSPRIMDRSFYQYQASSVAWFQGNLKKAIEHGRLAVQFADATGSHLSQALCHIELAVALFDDGQHAEAALHLAKGEAYGRGMHHIGFIAALHAARFAFALGDASHGLAMLRQGMALGAQQHYVNFPRWNDESMSLLCAQALQHGIELPYVKMLIKLRNLARPEAASGIDWPVRVRGSGRDVADDAALEAQVEARTRALLEQNRRLESMALTDELTGLSNRRHALLTFAREWEVSIQQDTPLSCLVIDADGFKQVNDNHGHDAGDEVLRSLSDCLRSAVRAGDVVCRLGGDEFLVICPGVHLEDAMQLAEQIRLRVSGMRVPVGEGEWNGSISVGVAARLPDMDNLESLIKQADAGVYMAKRRGRNCVAAGC